METIIWLLQDKMTCLFVMKIRKLGELHVCELCRYGIVYKALNSLNYLRTPVGSFGCLTFSLYNLSAYLNVGFVMIMDYKCLYST